MRYEKGTGGTGGTGDGDGDNDNDNCIDDWMISSILAKGEEASKEEEDDDDDNIEDDFDILDADGEIVEKTKALGLQEDKVDKEDKKNVTAAVVAEAEAEAEAETAKADKDGDGEYDDMDDYEDDDILVDEDAAAATNTTTSTTATTTDTTSSSSNIIKTRTYDLSITYDKYYQVPRVWMVGRSETNQPLTSKQMMEDVISDYANKTVTIEIHPHITSSCPHASIHPCQHSKVMKVIIKNLMKCDSSSSSINKKKSDGDNSEHEQQQQQQQQQGPSVETYLFIFLKFVSSMIPTINYDFTMEVTADVTSK
jgi:ubiquitin-like-conjugating enzyme ATG3